MCVVRYDHRVRVVQECFIYGLCDPRTGELRYVGQTSRGEARIRAHRYPAVQARAKGHRGTWLRALRRAGLFPDSFVIEHVSVDELADAEIFWIAYFRSVGAWLVNTQPGGAHARGYRRTDRVTVETRLRMSTAQKKRFARPAAREELSRRRLGVPGKPRTRECRIAQSLLQGGRTFVDQFGVTYPTIGIAADALKLDRSCVHKVLRGKLRHTGGYRFKYV